jgi:hypothetical protein
VVGRKGRTTAGFGVKETCCQPRQKTKFYPSKKDYQSISYNIIIQLHLYLTEKDMHDIKNLISRYQSIASRFQSVMHIGNDEGLYFLNEIRSRLSQMEYCLKNVEEHLNWIRRSN